MSEESGVVVGTDGTVGGDRAVAEAARLAASWQTTLHIVCAYRPASPSELSRFSRKLPSGIALDYQDPRAAEAHMLLEDAREGLPLGIAVRTHAERAERSTALCRVAERERAHFIVVTQGHGAAVLRRLKASPGTKAAGRVRSAVVMVDGGPERVRIPRFWARRSALADVR